MAMRQSRVACARRTGLGAGCRGYRVRRGRSDTPFYAKRTQLSLVLGRKSGLVGKNEPKRSQFGLQGRNDRSCRGLSCKTKPISSVFGPATRIRRPKQSQFKANLRMLCDVGQARYNSKSDARAGHESARSMTCGF